MGMKSNSNHFKGTNGTKEKILVKLDLQLFSSKIISKKGQKLLEKVSNEKVKNVIKELYRPGATIGDGGTASAIRYEIKTGNLVGGKSHILKGIERLKNLENLLKRNDLSKKDRRIVEKLHKDLEKALGGK